MCEYDEATIRELRDHPEFAAEYLRAALEEGDESGVLIALRRIAEARVVDIAVNGRTWKGRKPRSRR